MPVTVCYMLADLKAEMERHGSAVSISHPSVLVSDSVITDWGRNQMTGRQWKNAIYQHRGMECMGLHKKVHLIQVSVKNK